MISRRPWRGVMEAAAAAMRDHTHMEAMRDHTDIMPVAVTGMDMDMGTDTVVMRAALDGVLGCSSPPVSAEVGAGRVAGDGADGVAGRVAMVAEAAVVMAATMPAMRAVVVAIVA